MVKGESLVRLTPSMIPNDPNFDVAGSSFFQKWSQLPGPRAVQAQVKAQELAGVNPDPRKVYSTFIPSARPPPVIFKEMGLFVKWGSAIMISEGQGLYAINQLLKGRVPVPEVYGWRTEGDQRYIYMQYINGQTLEEAWDGIKPNERDTICCELRRIMDYLRQLEQDPSDPFIGNIMRGALYDKALHPKYVRDAGPFTTVHDFHEWLTFLHRKPIAGPYSVPEEPFRHQLTDNYAIKFTQGDLHRSNILISAHRPYCVLAILDWEQSGWFPAYWEARKATYTASRSEEWTTRYLSKILDQYETTWDPWDYYIMAMGC